MAITVAQFEEISALLRQVPRLVDRLEARQSSFVDGVLAWLRQVETTLENNRLTVVSQVAAYRATLIEAVRGVHNKDIVFVGRATPRKVQEATASMVLQRSNDVLHDVIAERQAVFQEAERVARQVMAMAEARGLIRGCGGGTHQQFLVCIQRAVAADHDLASAYAHMVALVGKNDVLVFMDRALAKVT